MGFRLAGHVLQAVGFALVALGPAGVVGALFVSGNYPGVPLWQFLAGAVAVAVPLMIAGGLLASLGRRLVVGRSGVTAGSRFRMLILQVVAYGVYLWLLGVVGSLPVFVQATGRYEPGDLEVRVWMVVWVLVFCGGLRWVTRPLRVLFAARAGR